MALDNCKLVGSGGLANKVEVTTTSAGNVPDQTLFITPNEGFTVAAEDFNVFNVTYGANGNSLVYNPSGDIDTITLSNTTTAHSLDNKVKVVVNLINSYVISSDTVLPIDLDGKGVEISTTIDVIPHIIDTVYLMPYPNPTVTITKVADNPPVIDNTAIKTYQHTSTSEDITYLPCTIQPDTPTKIATITVVSPASPGGGAYFSLTNPPNIVSTGGEASYGLSGVLKFELVEILSSQVVQNNGAITTRVFELFYQNNESHNFPWPSSYETYGSQSYTDSCRLVLGRPVYINPLESSTGNTIDLINMHDEIPVLETVPVKVIDNGNTGLINIGSINPTGSYLSEAVGNITKSTEDEPNVFSIQGTPGTKFTLLVDEDGHGKSGNAGLPTTTQTIPDSGVYVNKMVDIAENTGAAGKTFDLKVTAVGTSTVSQLAGRAQQTGGSAGLTTGEGNQISLRYKQPIKQATIKVTGSASSGIVASNTTVDTTNTTGGADPSNSSNCMAAQITGLGTSYVETQSHLTGVEEVVDFTMRRTGSGGFTNDCVVTGRIYFIRFGNASITVDINFSTIFQRDGSKNDFAVIPGKENPTRAITANVEANQAEALGDFTCADTKEAEFEITDLVASVI